MAKFEDVKTVDIPVPEIDFKDIEEMKEKIQADEQVVTEEESEFMEVSLDEEEFSRGVKKGSYFAGIVSALMTVGVPAELAIDVLINEETIAFNKTLTDKKSKEEIIEEELNKM